MCVWLAFCCGLGQGSPFLSEDLIRAGVRHAACALVFKTTLSSVDNVALLDADVVCISKYVPSLVFLLMTPIDSDQVLQLSSELSA